MINIWYIILFLLLLLLLLIWHTHIFMYYRFSGQVTLKPPTISESIKDVRKDAKPEVLEKSFHINNLEDDDNEYVIPPRPMNFQGRAKIFRGNVYSSHYSLVWYSWPLGYQQSNPKGHKYQINNSLKYFKETICISDLEIKKEYNDLKSFRVLLVPVSIPIDCFRTVFRAPGIGVSVLPCKSKRHTSLTLSQQTATEMTRQVVGTSGRPSVST